MTIRDRQQRLIGLPPATDNPALDRFLRDVSDVLNGLPPLSTFSYNTPESNVTAIAGTIGINLASNTTVSWLKQSGDGNTGWVSLQTA